MAQHDYDIANGGGAAVRADINNALAAIQSLNSGTSAPSATKPFMPWFDTTANALKMRNAADTAWVSMAEAISGGGQFAGLRNKIINGDMRIDQRNAGASVSGAAPGYTLDRWSYAAGAGSVTIQRTSSVIPAGFSHALGITVGTANTRNAADFALLTHNIEGANIADMDMGLATASSLTLSFWVRSSVAGLYSGIIASGDNNRGYAFNYTINAANTWEQKTISVSGDTSGGRTAWPIDSTAGLRLKFDMGSGSNYQITGGAWGAAINKVGTAGTVNWAQTAGATFYITGVQLERGTAATPFEHRPYGMELALCQRYLPAFTASSSSVESVATGQCTGAGASNAAFYFAVPTRVRPTGITVSSAGHFYLLNSTGGGVQCTGVAYAYASTTSALLTQTVASGLTAGNATQLYALSSSAQILFTGCEL